MKDLDGRDSTGREDAWGRWRWPGLIVAGGVFVILIALLSPREHDNPAASSRDIAGTATAADPATAVRARLLPRRGSAAGVAAAPTAEEIVAGKVKQFARSRRGIMQALARHSNIAIPAAVERFFDAVESGDWNEIEARFDAINGGDESASSGAPGRLSGIEPLWPAIIDAYGAAQQAHLWPAQKLLDYGNAVLSSLRPGMVYVGGTDDGRWVPALLNDTSDGERHVVITQNGLADRKYAEYMGFLYGDRLATLTEQDSNRAFEEYVADAQQRLAHDEQFPDEAKQIRPGEDVKRVDGRIQVSGAAAVFAINEKLLRTLMEKNPDVSFALQESYPLKSTYADATPLGPIMELRVSGPQNALTAQRAAQSVDYWRATVQQLLADAEATGSFTTLASYSKLAVGQANLFAERNFTAEAEQTYRIATEILPANVEAVAGLSEVLFGMGRPEEAQRLVEDFARRYPNQRSTLETLQASRSAGRDGPGP